MAVAALVGQLMAGSLVPAAAVPARATLAALFPGAGSICLADAGTAPADAPSDHRHRGADCAICPLCVSLSVPAAILAAGPSVSPPSVLGPASGRHPQAARAPPPRLAGAAQPRAPPVPA